MILLRLIQAADHLSPEMEIKEDVVEAIRFLSNNIPSSPILFHHITTLVRAAHTSGMIDILREAGKEEEIHTLLESYDAD